MGKKKTKQQLVTKTQEKKPIKKTKDAIQIQSVKIIAKKLLLIFKSHIGINKRISKIDLFIEVYGVSEQDINELKAWYLWDIIKKSCHYCRKNTRCKIISKAYMSEDKQNYMRYFFVASNTNEANIYINNLTKCQKAMETAKKQMRKAIRNDYHKDTKKWIII